MEKIVYFTCGSFPMDWGDFIPKDKDNPNVTISGGEKKDHIALDPVKGENGYWVDVDVVEKEINEEAARRLLSYALKLFHQTHDDFDIEIVVDQTVKFI